MSEAQSLTTRSNVIAPRGAIARAINEATGDFRGIDPAQDAHQPRGPEVNNGQTTNRGRSAESRILATARILGYPIGSALVLGLSPLGPVGAALGAGAGFAYAVHENREARERELQQQAAVQQPTPPEQRPNNGSPFPGYPSPYQQPGYPNRPPDRAIHPAYPPPPTMARDVLPLGIEPRQLTPDSREITRPIVEQRPLPELLGREPIALEAVFDAIEGEVETNAYSVRGGTISVDNPNDYVGHEQRPFFRFREPAGTGWYADPEAVPFAYDDPSRIPPLDTSMPRYRNAETATDDSGLVALCAIAGRDSTEQAQLLTVVGRTIVDLNLEDPDLMVKFMRAQIPRGQQLEQYQYQWPPTTAFDIFVHHELNRPERERLLALNLTDPSRPRFDETAFRDHCQSMLAGLQDALASGQLSQQQIAELEYVSHTADYARMVLDMTPFPPIPDAPLPGLPTLPARELIPDPATGAPLGAIVEELRRMQPPPRT